MNEHTKVGSSPRIRGEYPARATEHLHSGIIPANTGRIMPHATFCTLPGDHPREYGENPPTASMRALMTGSSPRIRGESAAPVRFVVDTGIIPANTGRIQHHHQMKTWRPDHPREYGENGESPIPTVKVNGSSPRIRGESSQLSLCFAGIGIIPANTGRMLPTLSIPRVAWDHPREYGENDLVWARMNGVRGSSPRIRGEYNGLIGFIGYIGIIPANTGRIRT